MNEDELELRLKWLTVKGVLEKKGDGYGFSREFIENFVKGFKLLYERSDRDPEGGALIIALGRTVYPDFFRKEDVVLVASIWESIKRKVLE